MLVDKSKIGLTFKHPRVTRETQEAALIGAGASWIVHVGKDPATWQPPVAQLQPGDVLYVYAAPMIPAPRKLLGMPGAQWTDFSKGVHERRAYMIEVLTGRRSNVRREWLALNKETHDILRHGGKRLPDTGRKPGRPAVEWPNEKTRVEWARKWKSRNYTTDTAVVREAKEAGLSERLIRKLGPSGRH